MKFLSLFSGIGGFDLGLERAGMQCVGQVEKDKFCLAVLAHHWPQIKKITDIYEVKKDDFEPIELICGGFPCQPFSLAGNRIGQKDDRYLWPEMLRVIKDYRPTWVLGENVAGIIGVELDKVLSELESIGYELQTFVIPAVAVDAPHRRDRVWIVANSKRGGCGENRQRGSVEGIPRTGTDNTMQIEESSANVSDPLCIGLGEHMQFNGEEKQDSTDRNSQRNNADGFCETMADTDSQRFEEQLCSISRKETQLEHICRWEPEPGMGRLAHGIPNRVAQLSALGNAVVPQVVEEIGKAIMLSELLFRQSETESLYGVKIP